MSLGIGGVRALQLLGYEPQVYHLNEGHAAFAMLEVARLEVEHTKKAFAQVKDTVRGKGVFTTHTPVPAGHDTFGPEQMERYFSGYWTQLGLSQQEFLALGKKPSDEESSFNMTVLALQLCRSANGVSRRNGEVCRQMWSELYPDRSVDDVPISYVTNGIHPTTWTAPLMADLYAQYLAEDWVNHVKDEQMWAKVEDYDMHVAEKLVQGVDIWLNNPLRPQEASGTSGQKASFNGGINCSVLDGWWCEAYQTTSEGKGFNGWVIGEGIQGDDKDLQNQVDAESLYRLLEEEIIPCYYDRNEQGLPDRWIGMMKASIKTIAPYFNTHRMVEEYIKKVYLQPVNTPEPIAA